MSPLLPGNIWQRWRHFLLFQLKASAEDVEAGVALVILSHTVRPQQQRTWSAQNVRTTALYWHPHKHFMLHNVGCDIALHAFFFTDYSWHYFFKCHVYWVLWLSRCSSSSVPCFGKEAPFLSIYPLSLQLECNPLWRHPRNSQWKAGKNYQIKFRCFIKFAFQKIGK